MLKKLSEQSLFLFIYFGIFGLGLIRCMNTLTQHIYHHLNVDDLVSGLCEWSQMLGHEKLPHLLMYSISLIAFILYIILYHFLSKSMPSSPSIIQKYQKKYGSFILFAAFMLNIMIILSSHMQTFLCFLWLLAFLSFPLLSCQTWIKIYSKKILHQINWSRTLNILALALVGIQFIMVFYPLIFKPMYIENDFINIPEKTMISPAHSVDNLRFMGQHHIGGLLTYDPRTQTTKTNMHQPFDIHIKLSPEIMLTYYLHTNGKQYKYDYNQVTQILSLHGEMTTQERHELLSLYTGHHDDQMNINQAFVMSWKKTRFFQHRIYSAQEKTFIEKNKIELINKMKAGWLLYHHSWVMNPLHAISLGAPVQSQTLIYGLLSTLFIKQMMTYLGGIYYSTYFKVMFSIFPVYFALFVGVVFYIFRKVEYALLAALLLSSSMFGLTDQLLQLAPGFNPIRHFFDVIVLLFFYIYLQKNNMIYLVCSVLLATFSILWSKDLGLFMLLAVCGTALMQNILSNQRSSLFILLNFCAIMFGLTLYCAPVHGLNFHFIYMLLGVSIPPTPLKLTIITLFFIFSFSLIYIRVFQTNRIEKQMFFLSICVFFYLQLDLIYFIWYPSHHHFLNIASTLIFLFLTWCAMYAHYLYHQKKHTNMNVCPLLLGVFIFVYLPTLYYFYHDRQQHNKIFQDHVLYDWTLPNSYFKSTMEPDLFIQSVNLIKRYEKHNAMYLISKYDAILPVITNKYNAIPSVNLMLDLISYADLKRMIEKINKSAPQYIFMDQDLMRPMQGEILNRYDPLARHGLYEESFGRVSVIMNLQSLYRHLLKTYEPMASDGLLTVYKKRIKIPASRL